jgi:transcriptional regulator with XRE-family HTH domain
MASTTGPTLGMRLAASRQRIGMSREALAVQSGLSWSAITQIEAGRRPNPRAETVAALGRALGVTADYLLGTSDFSSALLVHHSLVYEGVDDFVATAGPLVAEGLDRDEPTLVVSTPANIDGLRETVDDRAGHVRYADSAAWYHSPRAAFASYRDFARESLDGGAPWLRVVGEPVWTDRSDDEIRVWARYESLLNLAFAPLPLTLTCPYDRSTLPPEIIEHAIATHCSNLSAGSTTSNAGYRDPADFCLED